MRRNSFIVTFSGVDGSGKSQHIVLLRRFLRRKGISYLYIHSVSDSLINRLVKKFPGFKNVIGRREENSSGSKKPSKKISLFSVFVRYLILVIDGIYLRLRMLSYGKSYPVIIFDRYIFDKLVHTAYLRRKSKPSLLSFWMKLYPKPNLPIYLYVLPEDALSRKKEMVEEGQDIDYLSRKIGLFEEGKTSWKLLTIDTSELSISQGKKRIISIFKKRFLRFLRNK